MQDLVKSYWTDAHKKYSEHGFVTKPTIFAEEVLQYLPNSGKLLDLGAGQGQDSRFFAKHGLNVTSTDVTPHPLELSKQLAEKAGLCITFEEVNIAKQLPYKDGMFDVVYSHLALHYFDNKTTAQIFFEISRVLKSSGILAILLNTVEDPEIERDDFERIEQDFYQIPAGIHKRFFSVESLEAFTRNYFKPILLDNKGKTYKDEIQTLIRFVGEKK